MVTIDFYDSEDTYGRIETDVSPLDIKELLEDYKRECIEKDDGTNIDDFYLFLRDKDIKFETIKLDADTRIWF